MDVMTIDCGTCAVAGPGCDDCLVPLLLGPVERTRPARPDEVEGLLTPEEEQALRVLVEAGLVAPPAPGQDSSACRVVTRGAPVVGALRVS